MDDNDYGEDYEDFGGYADEYDDYGGGGYGGDDDIILKRQSTKTAGKSILQYILDKGLQKNLFMSRLRDLQKHYEFLPDGAYLQVWKSKIYDLASAKSYLTDKGLELTQRFPVHSEITDSECLVCYDD
jgi:hypothetical protein